VSPLLGWGGTLREDRERYCRLLAQDEHTKELVACLQACGESSKQETPDEQATRAAKAAAPFTGEPEMAGIVKSRRKTLKKPPTPNALASTRRRALDAAFKRARNSRAEVEYDLVVVKKVAGTRAAHGLSLLLRRNALLDAEGPWATLFGDSRVKQVPRSRPRAAGCLACCPP